jgi:hypothetical protein
MCEDIQRKNADAAFSVRTAIVTFVEVKEHLRQTFLNNQVIRLDENAPEKSTSYGKNGYRSIFGTVSQKIFLLLNKRNC